MKHILLPIACIFSLQLTASEKAIELSEFKPADHHEAKEKYDAQEIDSIEISLIMSYLNPILNANALDSIAAHKQVISEASKEVRELSLEALAPLKEALYTCEREQKTIASLTLEKAPGYMRQFKKMLLLQNEQPWIKKLVKNENSQKLYAAQQDMLDYLIVLPQIFDDIAPLSDYQEVLAELRVSFDLGALMEDGYPLKGISRKNVLLPHLQKLIAQDLRHAKAAISARSKVGELIAALALLR